MTVLRIDPSKPRVDPLPDFANFKATAFHIPIGSDLNEIDAILAQKAFILARHNDKVLFEIDSNGGYLEYVGLIIEVIYDLVDMGIDVRVLVGDKCYSVAMAILMIFPASGRYCYKRSQFMIHSVHFGPNQPELTVEGRDFVAHKNKLYFLDPIPASTRVEKESLRAALESNDDLFLSATEALELGIVSSIID